MDVFAVLLRSTRRLKMLLKSRSNTWQLSTTEYLIVFVPMTWLSAAILWYVSGLERFEDDSGAFCCATLRPHIVRWKMSTFRTQMTMATSVLVCQSAQIERETPKNVANERRFITAVATQVLASFSHQSWCQTSASLWNQAMTCLILSAEFLSSSQHSAALDSGHAGRDVLCIRDPKTWPCFGMAWLLLDSCFLLLVPHYRDTMGHPDPVWYCGTLYTLWPLRRWLRQVAKSKSLS
jgi:hypothetical protein